MSTLRFSAGPTGRHYAAGLEHTYLIHREGRSSSWRLVIHHDLYARRLADGSQTNEPVSVDFHDTLALAKATAEAFESEPTEVLFAEPTRMARAIAKAYAS